VEFEALSPQQRRVDLKEKIFDSGLGYLLLRVWRSIGSSSILLLDFPVYNSGLPSQVIQLSSYWPDGMARVSYGSRLEVELVNTGSGGLVADDFLDIWGTAIEEAWIPNPEVAALVTAISSQSSTLSQAVQVLTQSLNTAIAQQNEVLDALNGVVANQSSLIQSQRDLIGRLGALTPSTNPPTTATTQDTMKIHLDIPQDGYDNPFSSTWPPLPTPSSVVPPTLGGFETKANQSITFYLPYASNRWLREYQAEYTLIQNGSFLAWLPLERRYTRYYDGDELEFRDIWKNGGWDSTSR